MSLFNHVRDFYHPLLEGADMNLGINYPIQPDESRPIPPPGTPVLYQGKVIGRVVGTVQDQISVEIDGEHQDILTKHFNDITFGGADNDHL